MDANLNKKTMKALVYHGPHLLAWEDWPINDPGFGEVLVKVRAVGICGSDIHGYTGESGRRIPPMVMGHEAVGEVIQLGAGVSPEWLHCRVIVQPFIACGACRFCLEGRSNLCRERKFLGANISGAMAEYLIVPASNLIIFPDSLDFQLGVLSEPLSVAIHGVTQAGDLSGLSVFIVGAGPIGLFTLIAARKAGAESVIVSDLATKRLELALRMGADVAINPTKENIREKLFEMIKTQDADLAFDAVGLPATFTQALDILKPGGSLIAFGGWQTVPLDLGTLVTREIEIRGTFNFTLEEFKQAVSWLEKRVIDPAVFNVCTYPIEDGASVFEELSKNPEAAIKAVLTL